MSNGSEVSNDELLAWERDSLKEMCREIIERNDRLTPWEADFIDSVRRLLGRGARLTVRQLSTLRQIHDDRV